jgi:preprotein translocase subunit YajC
MMSMLPMIVIMFAIMYFLLIRPQQKQQKKQRAMLDALQKGDKVITNAGIYGTITGLTEATMTLEIARNVHIKILRGQIAGLQPGEKDAEGAVSLGPDKK